MPRYRYECVKCNEVSIIFHGMNDTVADCTICNSQGTLVKVLSVPVIATGDKEQQTNAPVGELTEDYIKQNKEILDQQRTEALKETYDPS